MSRNFTWKSFMTGNVLTCDYPDCGEVVEIVCGNCQSVLCEYHMNADCCTELSGKGPRRSNQTTTTTTSGKKRLATSKGRRRLRQGGKPVTSERRKRKKSHATNVLRVFSQPGLALDLPLLCKDAGYTQRNEGGYDQRRTWLRFGRGEIVGVARPVVGDILVNRTLNAAYRFYQIVKLRGESQIIIRPLHERADDSGLVVPIEGRFAGPQKIKRWRNTGNLGALPPMVRDRTISVPGHREWNGAFIIIHTRAKSTNRKRDEYMHSWDGKPVNTSTVYSWAKKPAKRLVAVMLMMENGERIITPFKLTFTDYVDKIKDTLAEQTWYNTIDEMYILSSENKAIQNYSVFRRLRGTFVFKLIPKADFNAILKDKSTKIIFKKIFKKGKRKRKPKYKPKYKLGDSIEAQYRGKPDGKWYPGKISKVHEDGRYDVNYDDGDRDQRLAIASVRKA